MAPMNIIPLLLTLPFFLSPTSAHPGQAIELRSVSEQTAHTERADGASKCAAHAGAMMEKRKLARRSELVKRQGQTNATSVPQHADGLKNTTCVLAPEVTEGPYYIRNEFVRPDLSESQTGVKLILDVGVMDVNTCQPLPDAFVELWACNSTGAYGGYTQATGFSSFLTDSFSWLRGGMATNDQGVVEITTVYPGWYTGRTVHIHTMIHTNYTVNPNGTLASGEGALRHIGQIFFTDELTTQIGALAPYNTTTQERTTNTEDSIFQQEHSSGNNAIAEHSLLGSTLSDGVLGYITIGIDTKASQDINNRNVQLASGATVSSTRTGSGSNNGGGNGQGQSGVEKVVGSAWAGIVATVASLLI